MLKAGNALYFTIIMSILDIVKVATITILNRRMRVATHSHVVLTIPVPREAENATGMVRPNKCLVCVESLHDVRNRRSIPRKRREIGELPYDCSMARIGSLILWRQYTLFD